MRQTTPQNINEVVRSGIIGLAPVAVSASGITEWVINPSVEVAGGVIRGGNFRQQLFAVGTGEAIVDITVEVSYDAGATYTVKSNDEILQYVDTNAGIKSVSNDPAYKRISINTAIPANQKLKQGFGVCLDTLSKDLRYKIKATTTLTSGSFTLYGAAIFAGQCINANAL